MKLYKVLLNLKKLQVLKSKTTHITGGKFRCTPKMLSCHTLSSLSESVMKSPKV